MNMNKSAIKNFAVNARNKLIEAVKRKAFELGIREKEIKELQEVSSDGIVIDGRIFNKDIKAQRVKLVNKIKEAGYEQVVEEVSYTWFNRFIALQFMEVNRYFEHDLNILSSLNPSVIASKAVNYLPLDKEKIKNLVFDNKDEELYKELIVAQCNVLYKTMPFLFEEINDYTELLFPGGLLNQDSLIREMVDTIPEEDWKEVEITGWLYQFYISEKKDEVFSNLKKNIKISKENIPAATQLFTPKWIVKYMVENSLGRLWIEAHPDKELQDKWKYYIEPAEQEPEVQKQLDEIIDKNIKPEDIKVLDPAMGSGHILVYAFEVLSEIYRSAGYSEKEIPKLILTKNLYGLDIDDRAGQLAGFALMMKAREYDSEIFKEDFQLNLCSIQEFFVDMETSLQGYPDLKRLCEQFIDGKEYGSLIEVRDFDVDKVREELERFKKECDLFSHPVLEKVEGIVKQGGVLAGKYDVVVTNPPYIGGGNMNTKLTDFVKRNFSDSKSDLFACFIEICINFTQKAKMIAMITQHSWMFLSSFQKLRERLLASNTISSMVHLGARAFAEIGGEVVQSTSFILIKTDINKYKSTFVRLVDLNNHIQKEEEFLKKKYRYKSMQLDFLKIPGTPVAYWVSSKIIKIFNESKTVKEFADSCIGMRTGDNVRFLRYWFEVSIIKVGLYFQSSELAQESHLKWFPYCKGGTFRKWYGNNEYLVNWENDGFEIKENTKLIYPQLGDNLGWKISNEHYYFKRGITWSGVTMNTFGVRCYDVGMIFDSGANGLFVFDEEYYYYFAGILNTKIIDEFIRIINPTINTGCGVIAKLPVLLSQKKKICVDELVKQNISISRLDWDSFETSWDFQLHPFIQHKTDGKIESAFNSWKSLTESQFTTLKSDEEELNRLFIEIYGLQDELTSEVEDNDIIIRKADLERDVKSFLSYAVGCMMGRYSLDLPGLAFAGGEFDKSKYKIFPADEDAIIPVLEDGWFEDDIVSRFSEFVKITFGENYYSENLEFIAKALGKKDNETAKERIRKYFLKDFYKDHLKIYKKRPIYWMFTSGKEQAFNALVYMHRYDKYTIARLRKDYLHELQAKIDRNIEFLEKENEKKKLSRMYKLQEELRKYDEILKHYADMQIEIDLDDGVVVNYGKFGKLLAGI
jgi:type II restriction/modification system DNA methylase subunit YeeA